MSTGELLGSLVPYLYLVSAVLFIVGLKRLSKVRTARRGNGLATLAMALAVVGTLIELQVTRGDTLDYRWIIGGLAVGAAIGIVFAVRVAMTAMPEMVALFNGFGGGASALVAGAVAWEALVEPGSPAAQATDLAGGGATSATIAASVLIGGVTFSGSLVALLKLQGRLRGGAPILLPGRHAINAALLLGAVALSVWFGGYATGADAIIAAISILAAVSLVFGVLVVVPIGGADMPVVVSLLNSYSGIAASAAGFAIGNLLLIIAGAMVGAAGLILTHIMCKAMNRSLLNVLVGGFGGSESTSGGEQDAYVGVVSCAPGEAAMILEDAQSVVFVPGYGMAVAQAQHPVRELADLLEKRGARVTYAIHPVAGRMPGHMNVLLADADVPYDKLQDMEQANPEFRTTDVAIVIGANDVVNPAAAEDKGSPIYGMPILNVSEARTVLVLKRSLSPGYAGIKNTLFERANTTMVFGDAKKVVREMVTELKELG